MMKAIKARASLREWACRYARAIPTIGTRAIRAPAISRAICIDTTLPDPLNANPPLGAFVRGPELLHACAISGMRTQALAPRRCWNVRATRCDINCSACVDRHGGIAPRERPALRRSRTYSSRPLRADGGMGRRAPPGLGG